MSSHRETSGAILIDSFGRFLFQLRDDNPEILYPGKIGLFGGHREGNETFLECVVREVREEISYFLPSESFAHLTSYEEAVPYGGTIHTEIFVANNVPADRLVITEGSLFAVKPEDVVIVEPRFSPLARFAMKAFLNDQQGVLSRLQLRCYNADSSATRDEARRIAPNMPSRNVTASTASHQRTSPARAGISPGSSHAVNDPHQRPGSFRIAVPPATLSARSSIIERGRTKRNAKVIEHHEHAVRTSALVGRAMPPSLPARARSKHACSCGRSRRMARLTIVRRASVREGITGLPARTCATVECRDRISDFFDTCHAAPEIVQRRSLGSDRSRLPAIIAAASRRYGDDV